MNEAKKTRENQDNPNGTVILVGHVMHFALFLLGINIFPTFAKNNIFFAESQNT